MDIAPYIDHTLLKPVMTLEDCKNLCDEAATYGFAAVCLPPPLVKNAKAMLKQSTVKVATVIGFPFGYSAAKAKVFEVQQAIEDGADELDMVINLVALKNKAWSYLEGEAKHIIEAAHKNDRVLKVIIESGVLTNEEIIHCCELYGNMGVDFLKTSTGYAEKGASVEAVQLMREHLPASVKIKASGGIRTAQFAKQLIGAGADRLGCSASVAIVKEEEGAEGY
ncbi:deoxyribose-phosphate aldolase [Pseudoflavitalea sp. G-6-1-2]|uniref:deoxyribose-phosphate aldolase n=1 Tax=Pseudoflavitalea sp. G-6-1-2 TaxID=2728841 RepID=UPI00146F66B4|nr:deoxyribose-phosphate aldolase [Pseudoflavitalea sp. G-6-1-2]NML22770.1 deoxyribose-phosphate aldolase [Pseudoflavitalea sp. G-6-1-2]